MASDCFIGIEQHFNEAATYLEKTDPITELGYLANSGLSLESPLLSTLAESIGYTVTSLEDFKSVLISLYQRFLDSMVKAWDYLVTYVDTVYVQVNQLLSRADELSDLAKERVSTTAKSNEVKLEISLANLTYEYKKLEPREYIKRLGDVAEISERVLLDHVSEVMNASKFISPLVESMMTIDVTKESALDDVRHDSRAIAKFGNEIHDDLVAARGEDVTSTRSDLLVGNLVTKVKRVDSLIGNKSIYVRYGSVDKAALRGEGIPFFTAIGTVFNSGMLLDHTDPNKLAPTDQTLKTLSPDDITSVCENVGEVLKVIRRFKVRYDRDLKEQRKRYQQLRGKLSVMARAGDNVEINLYLRRIGNAAMGLSRWYYDPFIPLISHNLKIVRAALVYCEKSLVQWPTR